MDAEKSSQSPAMASPGLARSAWSMRRRVGIFIMNMKFNPEIAFGVADAGLWGRSGWRSVCQLQVLIDGLVECPNTALMLWLSGPAVEKISHY